jgi:outer membrane protein OmpA-like peptidoglycan-associated protein
MKAAALLFAFLAGAFASFAAVAQDHPLLGRYGDSKQVGYKVDAYDEARIITGKINERGSTDQNGPGWTMLEGKITTLYYILPAGRTSLEAQRNYEASLKAKGFGIVFSCSTEAGTCFNEGAYPGLFLGLALDGRVDLPKLQLGDFVRNYFGRGNGRYVYARLDRPGGTVHVSLAFADDESRGRAVIARVIESTQMDTGMIKVVAADEMSRDLDARGRVDIYGILFDFDKADIKPESQPQLQQIAELLKRNAALRLDVVGHTDNQGAAAYNLKLSDLRAFAVVAELATRYGIDRTRLNPLGKGMEQPVASNADEAGRARNRRVELVKR